MPINHVADEFVNDIVLLPADTKLYMTRDADNGGVLVINPATKQILRRVEVINDGPFFTDDLHLTADNRYLWIVMRDAVVRGLAVLDTQIDSVIRTYTLHQYVPSNIGFSPSGRRAFLTTFDVSPSQPSDNVLFDVNAFDVISLLPRPHPPGTIRRDGTPVFRRDGKLVFVGRELTIDVYLHRERP